MQYLKNLNLRSKTPMNQRLQAIALHKHFGPLHILQGISFSANVGDVIAVLGSSGSGKSTLLRCINMLTVPDSGSLQIDEQRFVFQPNKPPPLSNAALTKLRSKIGMVFQQFNLWPHKTVLDNLIEAPIYVLKEERKSAIARAEVLLNKVGLADRRDHYPNQLSGGQQQRAAIARALMMKPEIMLFDEPTSALDPEMVGEVLTVMQNLASEGMTMLVATHELGFARNVANKALFLDQGQLIEEGTTKEMFAEPKTERFASFLRAVQR